jgi:hypothetical protein
MINLNHGACERDTLGLLEAVLVAEVAVDLHRERPAVLVSEALRDGGDVHSGFDAGGGEEVAKIMVGDAAQTQLVRRTVHGILRGANLENTHVEVFLGSFFAEPVQEFTKRGNHGNPAGLTVLGSCVGISENDEFALGKIAVLPGHVFCLSNP